jgi:hypothetical protein
VLLDLAQRLLEACEYPALRFGNGMFPFPLREKVARSDG